MEQAKKHFKQISIVVLVFAILSLVQIVAELLFGELNSAQSSENTLLIAKMILLGTSLLLLLPKFYVGIKGLRIAKNPCSTKTHIVWAAIILVFSALELIDPIVGILKHGNAYGDASAFFSILLEVIIYYEYIKYAKTAAKADSEPAE